VPIAGGPVTAVADARDAVHDIEATVRIGARSAWSTAQAFVFESSIRLREGTFAHLGASGQSEGWTGTHDRHPQAAQEKNR
jgi:hypothetical protein